MKINKIFKNLIHKYPLFFLTGLSLVLFICFAAYYQVNNPLSSKVIINNHEIKVEIAATEIEKQKGLGYRDYLEENSGMLFPYDHKEMFEFWMKGMNFPLDIIWIDGNIVVYISENVPVVTDNMITIVKPDVAVDKILELNSGAISRLGIKIGDQVIFKN